MRYLAPGMNDREWAIGRTVDQHEQRKSGNLLFRTDRQHDRAYGTLRDQAYRKLMERRSVSWTSPITLHGTHHA